MVNINNEKKLSVIIAAAGNASRLFDDKDKPLSKQFVLLGGKPLLIHSLEKFIKLKGILEIIIVTNNISSTNKLLNDTGFFDEVKIKIVEGSELRQDSVYNGFCKVDNSVDLVVIHDVARPMFRIEDLEKCIEAVCLTGAAVLAVPVVDTIKCAKLDKDRLIVKSTVDRKDLFLVQTPQVFNYKLLYSAYKMFRSSNNSGQVVTDEANMVEIIGEQVELILGDRKNIKITYPEDLKIAQAVLDSNITSLHSTSLVR